MPRPKMKPLPTTASEREVQRACLEVLAAWGVDFGRQNTGAARNSKGRLVMFGEKGNSDITGMFPPHFGAHAAGKRADIECKREGFRPSKQFGKAREHWERQVERLRKTNENGGYGFWVDDPEYLVKALQLIKDGYRVTIDDTEEPEFYREGE